MFLFRKLASLRNYQLAAWLGSLPKNLVRSGLLHVVHNYQ